MNEDKLSRAERIRLESLAQAMGAILLVSPERPSLDKLLNLAEKIELWLKKANGGVQ